jgi:hypothetical protein
MKFSIIKPIFKNGNKINLTNYRPISLLTFSEVFEKALSNRLTAYFNTNKLLVGNQFGFRKGTPTEDVIFKLINETLNALNNKKMAGSIFVIRRKVLDSVNHDILPSNYRTMELMVRLNYYLNLIFRTNIRVQITNLYFNSNTVSKWTKIKDGVLQGSTLGPLFLAYINDLPKAVEHKALPILFPDGTSIIPTSPNNTQMQSDFNIMSKQVIKWFKPNLLFFLTLIKIILFSFLIKGLVTLIFVLKIRFK